MYRISFDQMLKGLDQLFFNGKINNSQQAQLYADAIDSYLEQSGWDLDAVLDFMVHEHDIKN